MNADNRETFVLKCDRPRYDGGVEVDLERYFGRKLQPNTDSLRKSYQDKRLASMANDHLQQHLNDASMLDEYALRQHSNHPELSEEDALFHEHLAHSPALDLIDEFPHQSWSDFTETDAKIIAEEQRKRKQHKQFKELLLKGPLQIIVSIAGLATSVVALSSLLLSGGSRESFKKQVFALVQECYTMFWKGVWSIVTLPVATVRTLTPA
jgi:hypothetical protein